MPAHLAFNPFGDITNATGHANGTPTLIPNRLTAHVEPTVFTALAAKPIFHVVTSAFLQVSCKRLAYAFRIFRMHIVINGFFGSVDFMRCVPQQLLTSVGPKIGMGNDIPIPDALVGTTHCQLITLTKLLQLLAGLHEVGDVAQTDQQQGPTIMGNQFHIGYDSHDCAIGAFMTQLKALHMAELTAFKACEQWKVLRSIEIKIIDAALKKFLFT